MAVVAVAVMVGGCSSVPDAINPAKWYQNTVDYFSSGKGKQEEQKAEAENKQPPGANKPFPNLASVPAKPKVSPAEVRSQIAQGLVGDREGHSYAPAVPTQGAPVHALGGEPGTSAAAAGTPTPALIVTPPSAATPAPSTPVARAPATPSVSPPSALATEASAPPPQAAAPKAAPHFSRPVGAAPTQMPAGPQSFETTVISSKGVHETANMPAAAAPDERPVVGMRRPPSNVEGESGSIRVATIQFANGSAELSPRARAILRDVVVLQRQRGGIIRVVGHASSHTEDMTPVQHKLVNYNVSSARAEAVAGALTAMGAPSKDVVMVAKSDSDPLYYEFMPSGAAGNRRAEVYLDY